MTLKHNTGLTVALLVAMVGVLAGGWGAILSLIGGAAAVAIGSHAWRRDFPNGLNDLTLDPVIFVTYIKSRLRKD